MSIISNSSLLETFVFLKCSSNLSSKIYNPITALFDINFFGFSTSDKIFFLSLDSSAIPNLSGSLTC